MDRYEVQRSSDGRNFHLINRVEGRNQNCSTDYSCIDNSPMPGVSYYRLKMIGTSGDEKYSKIVKVEFKSDEFSLYPSILGQGENLFIANSNNTPLEISFYNLTGKKLAVITIASNQVPLKQLSLQKGMIIYKIYNSGKQEAGNGKIIIQ